MAGDEPEKGDKVSWNWGSGAPGGTVAEKKKEGEISITSKRGNKIKKNAEPNDPAVHIERSGNDVVKKASELNIEKKASGNSGNSDDKKDDESKTEKRKHDEEEKDEKDPHVKNADGKEVKPGGKTANKKQKQEKEKEKEKDKEDKTKSKKEEEKKAEKKEEPEKKDAPTEKKKPGRPKKGDEKKDKKEATPRQGGDLVSSRTRSRGK